MANITIDIKVYEAESEWALKYGKQKKRGSKYIYVVFVGPLVKIFTTERGAHDYLHSNGFDWDAEKSEWYHKYKSKDQIELERHYKKIIS